MIDCKNGGTPDASLLSSTAVSDAVVGVMDMWEIVAEASLGMRCSDAARETFIETSTVAASAASCRSSCDNEPECVFTEYRRLTPNSKPECALLRNCDGLEKVDQDNMLVEGFYSSQRRP